MAAEVGMEDRQAGKVAARMAVEVASEDRLAQMVAVIQAQPLVVGGVEAKAVLRAVAGKVGKVACLAVFLEKLHYWFLHKVCDTRQMLDVSQC